MIPLGSESTVRHANGSSAIAATHCLRHLSATYSDWDTLSDWDSYFNKNSSDWDTISVWDTEIFSDT